MNKDICIILGEVILDDYLLSLSKFVFPYFFIEMDRYCYNYTLFTVICIGNVIVFALIFINFCCCFTCTFIFIFIFIFHLFFVLLLSVIINFNFEILKMQCYSLLILYLLCILNCLPSLEYFLFFHWPFSNVGKYSSK